MGGVWPGPGGEGGLRRRNGPAVYPVPTPKALTSGRRGRCPPPCGLGTGGQRPGSPPPRGSPGVSAGIGAGGAEPPAWCVPFTVPRLGYPVPAVDRLPQPAGATLFSAGLPSWGSAPCSPAVLGAPAGVRHVSLGGVGLPMVWTGGRQTPGLSRSLCSGSQRTTFSEWVTSQPSGQGGRNRSRPRAEGQTTHLDPTGPLQTMFLLTHPCDRPSLVNPLRWPPRVSWGPQSSWELSEGPACF